MAVEERDPHTGYLTTGHEWGGITELNTPVPRIIYFFLLATFLFSLVYWVLMPAIPLGTTFTKGLLGADDRRALAEELVGANRERGAWLSRVEAEPVEKIEADTALMARVRETGKTLFGDNCAVCHGLDAKGGLGFPDLTNATMIWGGTAPQIAETLRVGINSAHPKARASQMLAFGRDGVLKRDDIDKVIAYVRSLSDPAAKDLVATQVAAGKPVFAAQCASCHGEDGTGKADVGGPNLTDKSWVYGGDPASLYMTLWNGRQGVMPAWEDRLTTAERKVLTLYLLDLRKP